MRADPRDDDEFGAIVEAHSSPDADGLSDEAREVQAVAEADIAATRAALAQHRARRGAR